MVEESKGQETRDETKGTLWTAGPRARVQRRQNDDENTHEKREREKRK